MIRPLAPADRAAWEPLWDAYRDHHPLGPGVTDAVFARLAGAAGDLHGFVAEHDDALTGFAHVVEQSSTWSIARSVYLEDLFVVPEARGTGIGRALIEAVYAFAGNRYVFWLTEASNAPARALYDRIGRDRGFVVYERPEA